MDTETILKLAKQAQVDKLKVTMKAQTEAGDVVGAMMSMAQLNTIIAAPCSPSIKSPGDAHLEINQV